MTRRSSERVGRPRLEPRSTQFRRVVQRPRLFSLNSSSSSSVLGQSSRQEARERAVGEQASAGLARRAVVRLVVGVDDPLDRRAARGAGLPDSGRGRPSPGGTPSPSRGSRRRSRRGAARSSRRASRASPRSRRATSLVGEPRRQPQRRQPRRVEDLVGVRVADAAEEARVGQRALERVVLARERRGERVERRRQRRRGRRDRARPSAALPRTTWSDARCFDPASVNVSVPCSKSNAARSTVRGTAAPGGLQWSRPAIIRWRTRNRSPSRARTIRLPSRSHAGDDGVGDGRERRLDAAHEERRGDLHAVESAPDDARGERVEVERDIGKLRHGDRGMIPRHAGEEGRERAADVAAPPGRSGARAARRDRPRGRPGAAPLRASSARATLRPPAVSAGRGRRHGAKARQRARGAEVRRSASRVDRARARGAGRRSPHADARRRRHGARRRTTPGHPARGRRGAPDRRRGRSARGERRPRRRAGAGCARTPARSFQCACASSPPRTGWR